MKTTMIRALLMTMIVMISIIMIVMMTVIIIIMLLLIKIKYHKITITIRLSSIIAIDILKIHILKKEINQSIILILHRSLKRLAYLMSLTT